MLLSETCAQTRYTQRSVIVDAARTLNSEIADFLTEAFRASDQLLERALSPQVCFGGVKKMPRHVMAQIDTEQIPRQLRRVDVLRYLRCSDCTLDEIDQSSAPMSFCAATAMRTEPAPPLYEYSNIADAIGQAPGRPARLVQLIQSLRYCVNCAMPDRFSPADPKQAPRQSSMA